MRKWVKRAAVVVGLLVLIIGALVYHWVRLLHGTPDWYRHSRATLAQQEAAARSAFNKFAGLQNEAAAIHNQRRRAQADRDANAANNSAQTITVSFTDDELNAFFQKWANFENWRETYEEFVDDPIIVLHPGQILLAGRVKDLNAVVSVEFDPVLDSSGRLNIQLTQIIGGRLPLPQIVARPYFDRVTDALRRRLPAWRSGAAIGSDGGANKDLISASLARLLIHTLRNEPCDPFLFLPVVDRNANVPVQITALDIEEHKLTITVRPLDRAQRAAMLARIQAPDPTIDPPTAIAEK